MTHHIPIRIYLFGALFQKSEWRKIAKTENSPFLTVTGCGSLILEYRRAWWPSILRLLVTGLPLFLIGTFFAIDTLMHTAWGQVIKAKLNSTTPYPRLNWQHRPGLRSVNCWILGIWWPAQTVERKF